MYTLRNSNNNQSITVKTMTQVKRILKRVKKQEGKEYLSKIFVDKAGDKDPFYATDLV